MKQNGNRVKPDKEVKARGRFGQRSEAVSVSYTPRLTTFKRAIIYKSNILIVLSSHIAFWYGAKLKNTNTRKGKS